RKLLAEHPFEAGVHPNFTVDADGAVLREVVEETVEAALPEGYGDPGDPDYLALASRGKGPVEIADVLYQLAATGLGPEALADDPLAAERILELSERLGKLTGQLLTLLEVRRIAGTRAKNACAILEGLGKLRRKLRRARQSAAPIVDLQAWLDACLPPALTDHLKLWARGETANRTEQQRLASALPKLARLSRELHRLREHVGNLDPELLGSARRVVAPLLER
ncbi:MAG: hypothetical protein GY856_47630, partial [bacterium]|nr:hypothetical protein [bacterium]